jgi:hypothetical protein
LFVKKLLGKNDIEYSLTRLDTLTQEEARMATAEVRIATAEVLKVTHSVDEKVTSLIDGAQQFLSPFLRS